MSKLIAGSAIRGAIDVVARAKEVYAETLKAKGPDHPIGFPATAYYLPVIYSFTGMKVEKIADIQKVLDECDWLLPDEPSDDVWLPYLGDALDAGAATLFGFEIIEACKTLIGPHPVNGIWLGAATDVIMRERGIEFVDGTAPGFAAVVGAAPDARTAVRIARELQEKNLYVFMAGATEGVHFAEQLAAEGVQLGWETRLVPFGPDVSAAIYALGFANRAALSFGGVTPGDFERNLRYNKNRIFAFVLALGEVDDEKYAAAAGAINYGFPCIADTDIPEILPTGVCTYEHVVSNVLLDRIVERALEVRGCKVKVTKVPIPVSYGPAFEGERIRKVDAHAEFGNSTTAFEFVEMVEMDEINDGEIEVIGPDVEQVAPGTALPLAIWVQVAGRKMQQDFEPILERQIHHLINGAEGIWHMGQRDIVWTRISKASFARGFRLRHYGEILHAKFLGEYPAIVDKVKVTLITDNDEVQRRIAHARKIYVQRNHRLESMTDESVDTFYSCLLCQSFAPNHVCVITPERLGLCGAYNWLDGKAAYEIDETGPNKPIEKGRCIDPVRGIWEGINDFVYRYSHKAISSFTAYSIMDRPMTSCGCFEAIMAFVPECNGVMIVNREFQGDTPVGMPFSTLAGTVGGGVQTPGFMGIGKGFITSRKFISADGGHRRIVWMTKELKEMIREDLQKRAEEQGVPDLLDRIADETIVTAPDAIRTHMEKVAHPALSLPDMASLWTEQHEKNGAAHEAGAAAEAAEQIQSSSVQTFKEESGEKEQEQTKQQEQVTAVPGVDTAALVAQIKAELKAEITREVVRDIIGSLQRNFLGTEDSGAGIPARVDDMPTAPQPVLPSASVVAGQECPAHSPTRLAAEKLREVKSVQIPRESASETIETVTLGGGRRRAVTLGGQSCMPFHFFEGSAPNKVALALEVFDTVSPKIAPLLAGMWGEALKHPAEMAKLAVQKYGADLVAVRLEGTHPEKGGRSADEAVSIVGAVLAAVDVPLIITTHNHFESANEVLKRVAAAFAGERLLLNWVEGENYRTIAGAALAYGHCVVAQSPIDVNMAKQLNILLSNMDLPRDRIVIDPMSGALGYGLEYTYSVMERIRATALGGDKALAFPMMVSVGQEAWKTKESRASQKEFPQWGDLAKRAVMWEVQTAMPFALAGADLMILNHPESLEIVRRNLRRLAQNSSADRKE